MPRPTIPDRRTALLDCAEALFTSRGFEAVAVADIARAAGVAKGAVYLEFPSKAEILQALLIRSMHRLAAQARAAVDAAPDSELGLGLLYRVGIEALLGDRLMAAAVLDDSGVLGRQIRALGPQRYQARMGWLRAMLDVFAQAGALASDLDLDDLTLALSSITIGLLSASSAIGPLTDAQLAGALDIVTLLVERGARSGPVDDAVRVRAALATTFDHLATQTETAPG